ncbi:uncharacterized protein LOC127005163 isoform X3 [Eriocheir sinensis]|uniref:uncharacterized protein LOC127005163 isoform X3 n=1 Tax=Eriocheir sinensis TaxID=95602 RepID=UPI0021C9AE62|nr:uncharacterized protein LOC127005163 isoform X3 [Eriocheir sinensis]
MAAHEGGTMMLSQLVQEVRELFVGKSQETTPLTCNAMSPRVILIRLTQEFIEKYTMVGVVKSEPLSDDDDWDMNILEPLVEISDKPKDNSKKRKRKENVVEQRKKGKQPNSAKVNDKHVDVVSQSEFINVSVKQEPTVPVPMEEVTHNVPMATIPVANTSAPSVPVYVYVPQPQPVVLQHPVGYSVQSTSNVVLNQPQNTNGPSTSVNTDNMHVQMDLDTNIKQEEMENVFVMPFVPDIETNTRLQSRNPASEPDIILCDSPEETTRKNRTAAIAENIGVTGPSGAHKKLRDLTFKLVELNNKNLQCDTKIDKIKEEFRKRLQIVEVEKRGIEQEIDNVLASIQDWKEHQSERIHK